MSDVKTNLEGKEITIEEVTVSFSNVSRTLENVSGTIVYHGDRTLIFEPDDPDVLPKEYTDVLWVLADLEHYVYAHGEDYSNFADLIENITV